MSTIMPVTTTTRPIKEKNPDEEDSNALAYIAQMNSKERIAYQIAKDHLGTSFNLKKSIGYKEWLKMNQK